MCRTRTRALDAAIQLVGTRGLHALTHGKVDLAAGLPKGSTSNHFRTRDALVHGAVEHLKELDRQDRTVMSDPMVDSVEGLVDTMERFVLEKTTTHRVRTVARYTLAIEATHNLDVRASLDRGHGLLRARLIEILAGLGANAPRTAARTLLAYVDGLVMRSLLRPEAVEPRERLLRMARACLDD